jgi:hypothetical protein
MGADAETAKVEERVRELVEMIARVEGYQPQGER